MKSADQYDVLAVIFARLEDYPSSFIQVELLREKNLKVAVIEQRQRSNNPIVNILNYLRFRRRIRKFVHRQKPRVVIAYDTFAMYLAGKLWQQNPKPKLIWHFHELPHILEDTTAQNGHVVRRAENFIINNLKHVDTLTFPDKHRATYLQNQTGIQKETLIAMNCPRLGIEPNLSALKVLKQKHSIPENQLTVYFHGALSESRCLDKVIQSIPQWKADCHLLAIGPVKKSYLVKLRTLARSLNVDQRFHYVPRMPYNDVLKIATGAQIGISIVHQNTVPHWRYSAGAVNKRFEYMAAGLPQITDNGIGVADIIESPPCGLVLDSLSPESIAASVNQLLLNPIKREQLRQNGIEKYRTQYHYGKQFKAIEAKILKWINE